MADTLISARIRTTPKGLAEKIASAPRNARGKMTEAAAMYLIGNERRGLKHYPKKRPAQKYVRTYNLRRAWIMRGERTRARASNKMAYASYVQGERQAWMHRGRWRPVSQVIEDNERGMVQAADQELNRYLKKKGLT